MFSSTPASWTAVSACPISSARLDEQKEGRDELPESFGDRGLSPGKLSQD
jgi:hypothetical protein